ncbi:uncharacterized protein LOC131884497 isoform X2 [Tigriopus californicus]|uniref:uncharacterized protein LOC131884497 isoform X2 n=1 Tax=Tigriopus californicus TaxID=6832 RepID=UPI0027DA5AD8|nr:uncharacterized protein LOC131884497 isoform X2 [Tigriopus californicus]
MYRRITSRSLFFWQEIREIRPSALGSGMPQILFNSSQSGNVPANIKEHSDAQKVQPTDGSRERSGQQTSQHFSSGFMNDQQSRFSSDQGIKSDMNVDEPANLTCQDMGGNAQLDSVLQTNVPEPYSPEDEGNLKEGIPGGLSDCPSTRDKRWTMEDRIDNSHTMGK